MTRTELRELIHNCVVGYEVTIYGCYGNADLEKELMDALEPLLVTEKESTS